MEDKETKQLPPDRFDPDVRFLLANERTLLAWVRTAIALMAGGLVAAYLGGGSATSQRVFGVVAVWLGAFIGIVGYIRFKAADKAIRQAKLPSIGYGPVIQLLLTLVVALGVSYVIAFDIP